MSGLDLGHTGEHLGLEILAREGYEVIASNYRFARGEVDLIGMEKGILAFVEVKTRSRTGYGMPAEAVDRRKRTRLIGAARHFLYTRRYQDQQCRFDVLAILTDAQGKLLRYNLYRDAFQVKGGNYF